MKSSSEIHLLLQLSVDGAISLSNVALNIRTINCLIEEADLPVEFVDGYIQVENNKCFWQKQFANYLQQIQNQIFFQDLSVTIPWTELLTESCHFTISGLTITLQVMS